MVSLNREKRGLFVRTVSSWMR